jgi:putative transposase
MVGDAGEVRASAVEFDEEQDVVGSNWTIQAARNFCMRTDHAIRFVIRDGAGQFLTGFDNVLRGEGAAVIRTSPYTPVANAYSRTLGRHRAPRAPGPDPHLEPSLTRTAPTRLRVEPHYNTHRPHRSLGQRAPNTAEVVAFRPGQSIRRHPTCNGLINQYRQAA